MTVKCTACNAEVIEDSRFCHECGALINEEASPDPQSRSLLSARSEPERRQVTVMFCDLVGSTQLSERYDPEDLRDLILTYQSRAANVIKKYQGFVARYVGDGLLVFFGYPEAHENDVERAAFAALEVVDAISSLSVQIERKQIKDLQVRIGIATGVVIVGDVISEGVDLQQSEIFGKTPNLAARIQGVAEPNTVLVESHTHRILEGRFEYRDMGEHELKGISGSTRVWQVVKAIDVQSGLENSRLSESTPMVNREDELEIFLQYWKRAISGNSRFILISGEAGIGKSRVVRELHARLRSEPLRYLRFQCSSYHQSSAFYTVIRHIERAAGLGPGDDNDSKLDKLKHLLLPLTSEIELAVLLVASLMSISTRDRYPGLDMSPERQKESTLELLVDLLVPPSNSEPALVVVEDVHWIDPSSEELLFRVISRLRNSRMLLVVTSRGAFPARWTTQPGVISLTMDRLSRDNCTEIIGNLTGRIGWPDSVVQKIVSRSDGVPLYVEELTKTVLASDASNDVVDVPDELKGSEFSLPASLQDSLMARLDQLNTGKRIAQISSVIGREFSYELLAAVSRLPEDELHRALGQLREAGIIYVAGAPPQARYIFKHALVRDAAYESLLKSRRRELHAVIAGVLDKQFPQRAELEPELLAQHYTEAHLDQQAIAKWQIAGRQALRRLAFSEAIDHVKRGLECLRNIAEPVQRVSAELALRSLLGPALMAKQGYGSKEVEEAYARAKELCEQVPETPELFPVLFGLWGFHLVRAEYRVANKLSKQLLGLGRAAKDDGLMVEAHGAAGVTFVYLGDLIRARDHLEQGMAVYDPEAHAMHAFLYGQDPWVACSSFHGQTMWLLGFAESGLRSSKGAVARARQLGHHFSVTFSQFLHCVVLQLRREPEKLFVEAEAGLKLSEEQGFPHWVPRFRLFRAWALTALGELDKGVAEMQKCLDKSQPLSLFVRRPYYLALLAEVKHELGETAESLEIVDDAIEEMAVFEDRWPVPEIYRIKGELLLGSTDGQCVETERLALENFERALGLARDQKAKAWELRILLSMHKLHIRQGMPEASRGALEATVGWFKEGMKMRDLVEAIRVLSLTR